VKLPEDDALLEGSPNNQGIFVGIKAIGFYWNGNDHPAIP
jgi:hypothetical protein